MRRLVGALTSVEQSSLAVVVSTRTFAALFTPLRRCIQYGINGRFFCKKYDAQQVLVHFAVTARDETDPSTSLRTGLDALTGALARVVQETLPPEGVSVWLRKQEAPKSALASSGLTGHGT